MPSKLQIKDKSQNEQLLTVAPFRKDIRKTHPHKHNNYFEIIYLSKGKGMHTIDNNPYDIRPPMIFFIRKEQVHHWELSSVPQGYVLILKRPFLDKSLDDELKALFTRISSLSGLHITDNRAIDMLFQLLVKEHNESKAYNFPIMEGLLKALLAKVLEVATPVLRKTQTAPDLFQSFRELTRSGDIRNNVAHYARLLKTTPQNLNAICRRAVDQSAAIVLSEHLISEAQRLLLYTSNTVAEISFMLGFKDPSHFVKYFKRFTGQTPGSFRRGI